MDKFFRFLRVKKRPTEIAFVSLVLALILETLDFVLLVREIGFYFERCFAFIFDVLVIIFVLYGILKRNEKLLEIAVVVLKAFEGTYYPLLACQKIDILVASVTPHDFYIADYVIFGISAFMMFIALIFYCIHKVTGTIRTWNFMKLCILIASFAMIINTILFSIATVRGVVEWNEIVEPICLSFMFFGVYATCEYIEEKINHVKKVNLA